MINQISVFVENKPGRLTEITAILAEAGVNLRAASIGDTADFGILRIIVDKPEQAEKILKESGLAMSVTKVLGIKIPDQPGGFAKAVKMLSDGGISIEYMYAFNTGFDGNASIILRVSDNQKAVDILTQNGVELIGEDDISC